MIKSFIFFHYWLLNKIIDCIRVTIYTSSKISNPKQILLVRKGNLGDIICSVDVFESIKKHYPQASIDLLTTSGKISSLGAKDVLPFGYFNKIINFNEYTLGKLFKLIKGEGYDMVIELPPNVDTFTNQIRNMFFFRLTGIKHGFGWCVSRTNFLRSKQVKLLTFNTEQNRLKKIVHDNGISVASLATNEIFYSATNKADVTKRIEKFTTQDNLVAVCIGAKLDKQKWPVDYFKKVINDLIAKGMVVIAIGDKHDANDIEAMNVSAIMNFCGKLSVRESAAILSLCQFTLCNDSGPMHLSYSVGTPVVAIFSSRNYYGSWFPPDDDRNVIFYNKTINCAGCMNKPCASNDCMKSVLPKEVIARIDVLLNKTAKLKVV